MYWSGIKHAHTYLIKHAQHEEWLFLKICVHTSTCQSPAIRTRCRSFKNNYIIADDKAGKTIIVPASWKLMTCITFGGFIMMYKIKGRCPTDSICVCLELLVDAITSHFLVFALHNLEWWEFQPAKDETFEKIWRVGCYFESGRNHYLVIFRPDKFSNQSGEVRQSSRVGAQCHDMW